MDDLDDMLGALRKRGPVPSDALMARVLADGQALQPRPVPPARAAGPWQRFAAAFGGFGAIAGLAAAAVAGLAIGLAAPTPADALTAALWGTADDTAVVLIPSLDEVLADDGS